MDIVTGDMVLAAAASAAVVVVVTLVRRPFPNARPLPIGGAVLLGLALAAWWRADEVHHFSQEFWLGVALAAVGSIAAARLPVVLHLIAVIPGVVITVDALAPETPMWMRIVTVGAGAIAGTAGDRFERTHPRSGAPFVMGLGSVAAVWLTVPETDIYRGLMSASVPLVLLAWPRPQMRFGPGGFAAVMAVVCAMALEGGQTRPGGVVGGVATAGLLLLGLGTVRVDAIAGPDWTAGAYRLVGIHSLVTFCIVRIAGLRQGAIPAAVLLAVIYGAGFAAFQRWVGLAGPRPSGQASS